MSLLMLLPGSNDAGLHLKQSNLGGKQGMHCYCYWICHSIRLGRTVTPKQTWNGTLHYHLFQSLDWHMSQEGRFHLFFFLSRHAQEEKGMEPFFSFLLVLQRRMKKGEEALRSSMMVEEILAEDGCGDVDAAIDNCCWRCGLGGTRRR